jgi:hypothetical protein
MKLLAAFVKDRGYELPIAYYDFRYRRDAAPLLDHLACVIDHVRPHARGGKGDARNLAVACNKCNVRKGSRDRPTPAKPVRGKYGEPKNWDGLSSLFVVLGRDAPESLTTSEQLWLAELEKRIARRRAGANRPMEGTGFAGRTSARR